MRGPPSIWVSLVRCGLRVYWGFRVNYVDRFLTIPPSRSLNQTLNELFCRDNFASRRSTALGIH